MKRHRETRISDLRLDKSWKQKDMAKKTNVSESTYSKWERGSNDIPLSKANELANIFEVSLDYMLGISSKNIETERKEINLKLLPERLLEIRKKRKITQEVLCNEVGYPQRTYSNYETGNRTPTTFKLLYIAIYHNISVDYLLGRTDDKKIR